MENKGKTRGKSGGKTRLKQSSVFPFVSLAIVSLPIKTAHSLSYPCLQLLLIVAYYNEAGNTVTMFTKLLYGANNGTHYRNVQYRLEMLLSKGLIERHDGKYRLSEKGARALSSVVVEGEGAKLLLEIERKQARSEAARAKRVAKNNGDL